MAITKAAKVMDARRDSETGAGLSKEYSVGVTSPSSATSSQDAGATRNSCDACLYCSDTCGDISCIECDSKLSRTGCSVPSGSCSRRGFLPSYTMCEIRRHNTPESAWLVAGDTIYDATTYMKQHPGGERSILKKSGGVVDCTMDFQYHSNNGRKMWKKYEVGKVKKCPGCDNSGEERQWWMFWS